ncbi:MAG: hypothetical protein KJ558_09375 [Gammaproteobacteria bacterium]|nr:hypothetical protein [Gammaproteobacteria bacterium]MBU1655016.1 hypothetical protein [Gammaproteobacteria bacterium]MBU1960037.1 hypothetical protein [Gammaproteobacteria bacterium]
MKTSPNPIEIIEQFLWDALQILRRACDQGGNREDWIEARDDLQDLEARADAMGAEAAVRRFRDLLAQVEICIHRPEAEMAQLRDNGFILSTEGE